MLSIVFLWIVLLEPKVFSSFISYVCVILSTKLCETGSLVASKKKLRQNLFFPRLPTATHVLLLIFPHLVSVDNEDD